MTLHRKDDVITKNCAGRFGDRFMQLATIKNECELDKVLRLVFSVFPELKEEHRYNRNFWLNQLTRGSEFLLFAKCENAIMGAVFAWSDNAEATIAICCVDQAYWGKGVGRTLMQKIEKVIKAKGFQNISLGAQGGTEEFYLSLGYTGALLIQLEIHSIDQLKSVNPGHKLIYAKVYENTVNQACLRLPKIDRVLQRKYKKTLPGCYTQMIFQKTL